MASLRRLTVLLIVALCLTVAPVQGAPVEPPPGSGAVIAVGEEVFGQLDVPPLPPGVTYTTVAAGFTFTMLLRSDGRAVAIGHNISGESDIPDPPAGTTYTDIDGGFNFMVVLSSDGTATGIGSNGAGQISIPPPPDGTSYTAVAAGDRHTVLLRSDGHVTAVGPNDEGQTDVPPPPDGTTYTAVAAGRRHTVLLRSDGHVTAVGLNDDGQTDIPPPPDGTTYTAVAAGRWHTVLLDSSGRATAHGGNDYGQTDIPDGRYTGIAAGDSHTILLRPDGGVTAIGRDHVGQTDVPPPPTGTSYVAAAGGGYHSVLLRSAVTTGVALEAPADVQPGAHVDVTATVEAAADVPFTGPVRFTVGDQTIETDVDDDGRATATIEAPTTSGDLTVSARYLGSTDGSYLPSPTPATATIEVTPGPLAAIELTAPDGDTITEGDTIDLAVTGTDTYGNPVPVDTEDVQLTSNRATDTVDGLTITLAEAGAATLTATVGDLSDSLELEVAPATRAALPAVGGGATLTDVLGALALLTLGIAILRHPGRARA